MSNKQRYNSRAITFSCDAPASPSVSVPTVPIQHTPPDRPFITRKDVRYCGGTRKVKKQGKGHASNPLYHPLVKPRLAERRTYRQLEAMINPTPKYRVVGPFKIYS